jgi:hypothetical protein
MTLAPFYGVNRANFKKNRLLLVDNLFFCAPSPSWHIRTTFSEKAAQNQFYV